MDILLQWLKEPARTYNDGLKILKSFKHHDLEYYSRFEDPGTNDYVFRMLHSLIKNIARKESQKPVSAESPAISAITISRNTAQTQNRSGVTIVSNPIVDFKELPENLQSLFLANKSMTKQIAQDHVLLKSAKIDVERKLLLEVILENETTRAANWKTIDTWWSEKQNQKAETPEEISTKKEIQDNTLKQIKRINGLKIYISRATKELKDLSGKKAESRKAKIEIWKTELHELEKQQ